MNKITGDKLTEQHLVQRVLSGDTHAFGRIIKNTEGLVAQIVFKMISNAEDRKDLAQDVYLKVFTKLSGFRFQSKLSTWIGQIAYHTCLSYLEKKKLILPGDMIEETESGSESTDFIGNRLLNTDINETESLLFQKKLSEVLGSAIENLAPVYRTLITLYYNEELSNEEIGQITGLPEGTIKSYLFRARKAMKESILFKYRKEEL